MSFQVPEYIRSLVPYLPGKPIEETQREYNLKKVIKLASNENPLGASPKAMRAIQQGMTQLHRYPDGSGYHLKQALSELLKVSAQSLILGNGSNDVIDFLVRTYCLPGDSIATHQASFIAYKICAQIHGVKTLEVSLNAELKWDVNEMLELIRKNEKVRIVFIANPNNPTGTYVKTPDLKRFLKEVSGIRGGSVLVVLDYAYWEYVTASDLPDPHPLLKEYPNLVILRTFSKVYGLGGLRVGYGVASPTIISDLEKVRQPFNVSSLGLLGATAALSDLSFVKKALKMNERGMRFWEKRLTQLSIPFWKSQGNFILVDVLRGLGKTGVEVQQESLRQGVIFRPVANYGLSHALRISIGTPEENEFAAKVLASSLVKVSKAPAAATSKKKTSLSKVKSPLKSRKSSNSRSVKSTVTPSRERDV